MPRLGVNVDHVATLREARGINYPDPVYAAVICELAGCDSIVIHLRQDRRHIKDSDLEIFKKVVKTKLNLEMSLVEEIVDIARRIKPDQVTFVPEKRQELTTEGGLNVKENFTKIKDLASIFKKDRISVSLFVDPEESQIKASEDTGVDFIELHTGKYANAKDEKEKELEIENLKKQVRFAKNLGLRVNAGHGLNYKNVSKIVNIPEIEELNIGHSIISHAVFVGLDRAVREMLKLINPPYSITD